MVLLVYFNAVASIRRIEHFFIAEEIEEGTLVVDPSLPNGEVRIENGAEFCWETVQAAIHNEDSKQFVRKMGPPQGAKPGGPPGSKPAGPPQAKPADNK